MLLVEEVELEVVELLEQVDLEVEDRVQIKVKTLPQAQLILEVEAVEPLTRYITQEVLEVLAL